MAKAFFELFMGFGYITQGGVHLLGVSVLYVLDLEMKLHLLVQKAKLPHKL